MPNPVTNPNASADGASKGSHPLRKWMGISGTITAVILLVTTGLKCWPSIYGTVHSIDTNVTEINSVKLKLEKKEIEWNDKYSKQWEIITDIRDTVNKAVADIQYIDAQGELLHELDKAEKEHDIKLEVILKHVEFLQDEIRTLQNRQSSEINVTLKIPKENKIYESIEELGMGTDSSFPPTIFKKESLPIIDPEPIPTANMEYQVEPIEEPPSNMMMQQQQIDVIQQQINDLEEAEDEDYQQFKSKIKRSYNNKVRSSSKY